jgi:hypothetical protein
MINDDIDFADSLVEAGFSVGGETLAAAIAKAGTDDVQGLIKRIAAVEGEADREIHIANLSKKLKVKSTSIRKDVLTARGVRGKKNQEKNDNRLALFPGLVDLALSDEGRVVYVIKTQKGLSVAASHEIEGKVFRPPDKNCLPFALPRACNVLQNGKGDDPDLAGDIMFFLKRFSYLEEKQFLVITCYVFLTYLQDHPQIQYLPIICFFAVPERGKSRTGRAMTYLSYHGIHVIDVREANLFRYSGNLGASMFFDVMNLWKKTERSMSEDILLSRYEKGATVSRVVRPECGAFKDTEHWPVFGATVIATNEAVHNILGTRCLTLTTPNAPGRYENLTPDMAIELKERLVSWRARHMDCALPDIEPIEGLSGRLWDISRPLLQVCSMVYPGRLHALTDVLLEVAGQRSEEKKASMEGLIVASLDSLSPDGDETYWELATADVLKKFNESISEDWKKTPQWLGRRLKALGLETSTKTGHSIIQMNRETLDKLLFQYGFIGTEDVLRNSEKPKEESDVPF